MESKIDRLGFAEIGEKNQKNQSKTLGEKQNEEKRAETTNNVGFEPLAKRFLVQV